MEDARGGNRSDVRQSVTDYPPVSPAWCTASHRPACSHIASYITSPEYAYSTTGGRFTNPDTLVYTSLLTLSRCSVCVHAVAHTFANLGIPARGLVSSSLLFLLPYTQSYTVPNILYNI